MRNSRKAIAISLSLAVCVLAAFLTVGGTAYGNGTLQSTFNTEYSTGGTALDTCSTCHTSGSSFNPYGQAINDAGGEGADAGLAAIQAVEGDDSDGDGFSNFDEIDNLTFPGDNTSFPAAVDNTAPAVTSTVPADNAVNVAIDVWIMATFDEAIDPATVDNTSFILTDALDNVVDGTVTVSADNTTATFTPSAFLDNTAVYTATLTTDVTDLAGNPLADNVVWSFTTGTGTDTIAPTVLSTVPADGATGVAVTTVVAATFDEAIDPVTVDNTSFFVNDGAGNVDGTITFVDNTATFTPSADLAVNTVYTATLTTDVTDASGNPLADNVVWSFTTAVPPPPDDGGGCSVTGAGSRWDNGAAIAILGLLAMFVALRLRKRKDNRR